MYTYEHVYTGDRRYPVYPGYEDLDPLAGPNSRQELMNREGLDFDLVEGEPRPWPRSAVNDTNPIGSRWVDLNMYPENFGHSPPWRRQDGESDERV